MALRDLWRQIFRNFTLAYSQLRKMHRMDPYSFLPALALFSIITDLYGTGPMVNTLNTLFPIFIEVTLGNRKTLFSMFLFL